MKKIKKFKSIQEEILFVVKLDLILLIIILSIEILEFIFVLV